MACEYSPVIGTAGFTDQCMAKTQQTQFEGGAFSAQLPHERTSGLIGISGGMVHFVSEETSVSLPLTNLTVKLGGAANRLIFFSNTSHPEWTVFTSDAAILKHPDLIRDSQTADMVRGIQRRRMLTGIGLALVLLTPLVALLGLFLAKDWLVDKVAQQVPVAWEKELGETMFQQLSAGQLVEDPEIQKDFDKIASRLIKGIGSKRYEFKFYIVKDDSLNAFALPGGTMAIHTGLLLKANSAEEVAGVMAHELAHVTEQHGVTNLIETAGLYLVVIALFGDATGLLAVIANNAPALLQMKFSRDHEREADTRGFEFLVAAEIDPRGMATFFKKMHLHQEEKGTGTTPDFLSTHPSTTERINNLEQLISSSFNRRKYMPIGLNYEAFKARLREELGNNP